MFNIYNWDKRQITISEQTARIVVQRVSAGQGADGGHSLQSMYILKYMRTVLGVDKSDSFYCEYTQVLMY